MEVRNCKGCGRLFNYLGGRPLCQVCAKKLEEKFQEVKAYIRANAHANIQEVSEANDVEVRQIKQWIREERLSFTADSPITIDCEVCGAPIRSGRYCDKCKSRLQGNLEHAIEKPIAAKHETKERDKDRMRFLDKL